MRLCRKRPRPLTREEKSYRDDRLFVIATEDTHAPDQYFSIFKNPRIKVLVLPTIDSRSSPKHVFERLNEFSREFDLIEDDQLWLMLDTDHWVESNHIDNFRRVCTLATQKGFRLAHSNPCFEIWLLLHETDLAPDEQFEKCADVVDRLRATFGAYSKSRIDCDRFSPDKVAVAVARAERLDGKSNDRWPQKTGSHVYRVVRELIQE